MTDRKVRLPVFREGAEHERIGWIEVLDLKLDQQGKPITYAIALELKQPGFSRGRIAIAAPVVAVGEERALQLDSTVTDEELKSIKGFEEDRGEL